MQIKVLECRKFSSTAPIIPHPRTVCDYEIDLEIGEPRTMVIDGVSTIVKRGDVSVRFPGQQVYSIGAQSSILLTVDFSGRKTPNGYNRSIAKTLQPLLQNDFLEDIKGVLSPVSEYTFLPIYEELLSLSPNDCEAAEALIFELIYKIKAEYFRKKYQEKKPQKSYALTILNYMKNNLEKNITLDSLAEQVNLNKSYLVRLFKSTYGKTPMQVLIALRMEKAYDLIVNTNISISQIAFECGFSSDSYFIAGYKKRFFETPLQTRIKNFPKNK